MPCNSWPRSCRRWRWRESFCCCSGFGPGGTPWYSWGVNLLTQGGLTLWMSVRVVRGGANGIYMLSSDYFPLFTRIRILLDYVCYEAERISPRLFPAEIFILLAEAILYRKLFRDCSLKRAVLYALAANLGSFLLVEGRRGHNVIKKGEC